METPIDSGKPKPFSRLLVEGRGYFGFSGVGPWDILGIGGTFPGSSSSSDYEYLHVETHQRPIMSGL